MYIDSFCHFLPIKYYNFVCKTVEIVPRMLSRAASIKFMSDEIYRNKIISSIDGYTQIISSVSPTFEMLASQTKSPSLAKVYNDSLCELVNKYPQYYNGFIASLPLNNLEASAKESIRAVKELGAKGIQLFTNINDEPLDKPENSIIFDVLSELDVPILLHPVREYTRSDYLGEDYSRYEIWWALGWLYETSVTMLRLAFWGIFEKWPNLKVMAHHAGGMIPISEGRIKYGLVRVGNRTPLYLNDAHTIELKGDLEQQMRKFYVDTATFGSIIGIQAAITYFGIDNVIFATDCPFGAPDAEQIINTIESINSLHMSDNVKNKIFYENAKRIFKI